MRRFFLFSMLLLFFLSKMAMLSIALLRKSISYRYEKFLNIVVAGQ